MKTKTDTYKQTVAELLNMIPTLDDQEAKQILVDGINKFNELITFESYVSPLPSMPLQKMRGNKNHV